jgi:hypothetical protein
MMSNRRLLADALTAIDQGRASSEEILRAAFAGPQALTELLKRAARRKWRRPTVWRVKKVPSAVIDAAVRSVKKRLGRSKNVKSVHWGVRRRRGRRTAETAVVVHVERKLALAALRARRLNTAPSSVTIRHLGTRFKVDVDVQAVKELANLQAAAFMRPGDHGSIQRNGHHVGALGAIVSGPNGQFAITAGHVAGVFGPSQIANCKDDEAGVFAIGTLRRNRFHDGIDIGAIGPVATVPPAAVLDLTFARNPTNQDTNRRVQLMVPGISTPMESHVDDVNVRRGFNTPLGPITMAGLTAIRLVTVKGDSGAPALDENGVLVGFVVGADNQHTYLLPARRALDALDDAL